MDFRRAVAAGLLAAVASAGPAAAQGAFGGAWTVVEAKPAPWVDGSPSTTPDFDPAIQRATVVFRADRVEGPPPIGCRKVQYEVKEVEPGYLFQGGLADPERQAAALGFAGNRILNLTESCDDDNADVELEFALATDGTALLGLNNVVYRFRRQAAGR
jgi:hypothetical protein